MRRTEDCVKSVYLRLRRLEETRGDANRPKAEYCVAFDPQAKGSEAPSEECGFEQASEAPPNPQPLPT